MSPAPAAEARGAGRPLGAAAAACVLGACALIAYHNCFSVPFVYDDIYAISENPTIRHLWPPTALFSSPAGDTTVGARPLANLTLAFNYAVSGYGVWSYHLLNLAIHVLASLALFGLVRRTLERPALAGRFKADAAPLALAASVLWLLHPLQTECVTYVIQRVESLMGLFLLGSLYAFVRACDSPKPARWQAVSFALCLLGVLTKEVMATAPLLILLYDRTFVAGGFRASLSRRRGYYLSLALTWIPLLLLVASSGWNRRGSAGFNAGVPAPAYWATQCEALVRYLGLCLWPRPLVFEYGPFRPHTLSEVLPFAALAVPLVAAAAYALWRRPLSGFLGAWCLIILAPSSLVPVATQTMAEHRLYLPLAAVATCAAIGAYAIAGRRSWIVLGIVAAVLGFLTERRNATYRTTLGLWADTVAKRPGNINARNNYGLELFREGRTDDAIAQYEAALAIRPDYPGVQNNLGNALHKLGRVAEAIGHYRMAIATEPGYAAAHFNLARALESSGDVKGSVPEYREAVRLEPARIDPRLGLARALVRLGSVEDGAAEYRAALLVDPDSLQARDGLAEALQKAGNSSEAAETYLEALRRDASDPAAHDGLGLLLFQAGRAADALGHFEAALRAAPRFAKAHFDLANALAGLGRVDEAEAHYADALADDPGMAEASNNLGIVLCRSGRVDEGIERIRAAVRLDPGLVQAHFALGTALLQSGRGQEALAEYRRVLALHPDDPAALRMIRMMGAEP